MVILQDSLHRIAQIKIVVMFLVFDRIYKNIFRKCQSKRLQLLLKSHNQNETIHSTDQKEDDGNQQHTD